MIKDTILKNIDLPLHVRVAVFECYLQHFDRNAQRPAGAEINQLFATTGTINRLLSEICEIELRMALNGFNEHDDLIINGKRGEINLLFDEMPNLDFFENLSLTHNPKIFFQTLVNCIRNNVLSHQSDVFKLRNAKKYFFKKQLNFLKQNFNNNAMEILRLERNLSTLIEGEIRDELSHYKNFECLNNERMTPHFLNLVKGSRSEDNLSDIKRDNGENFSNKSELKQHVFDY